MFQKSKCVKEPISAVAQASNSSPHQQPVHQANQSPTPIIDWNVIDASVRDCLKGAILLNNELTFRKIIGYEQISKILRTVLYYWS